jgi:arylsulfatase A-like enzyme
VAVLLALVLSLGCRPSDRPPNLIVISLDTLRADALGSYGQTAPTSPELDAIASAGTIFVRAYAPSPWTLPSNASLLTGSYAKRHGATHQGSLRDDAPHLARILRAHGYQTHGIVNSLYLARFGVLDAFASSSWVREEISQREPSSVARDAIDWLERRDPATPFFLFLHFYDAHSDYLSLRRYEDELVEPYSGNADGSTQQLLLWRRGAAHLDAADMTHLKQRYLAGVRQLDAELGRLFEFLRGESLLESSVVVIVADHGEEFLEHGGVLHGRSQYEEVVRIPMIFAGRGVPSGVRLPGPLPWSTSHPRA